VSLIPPEDEAPESSLAYMVARFQGWFFEGRAPSSVWRGGRLDTAMLVAALDEAHARGEPVCLLGTSFAFVFAEDALGDRRFALPAGSRIMQTGGFKGRSREVDPEGMRAMLALRYGVPDAWIVAEYGMTELSSQMYETTLADALRGGAIGPRRLSWPGWVRVDVRDPETLAPLPRDAVGLLRIEDAANVDTLWAVQTSDLARRSGDDGIVLVGRAPGATPRGCSLAIEEALGRPG
jgi:acyl-CoA synthetase (AMP-forming)/AMP-acid ligase II